MKREASSKRSRRAGTAAGAPNPLMPTVRWTDWAMDSRVFPTVVAAAWFLRRHKGELARRRVLLKISRTWYVVTPGIEQAVLEIGQRIAITSAVGKAEQPSEAP